MTIFNENRQLLDELERGQSADAPARNIFDENRKLLDALELGSPAPAPASEPEPTRIPTAGGGVVRMSEAVAEWMRGLKPQDALDLGMQGAGTAAGIAAGSLAGPAAPVAMPAGGAAGNITGKQIARAIGQLLGLEGSERPELASIETTVDGLLGTTGPVIGSTVRGVTRLGSGISRETASTARSTVAKVEEEGARKVADLRATQRAAAKDPDIADFELHIAAKEGLMPGKTARGLGATARSSPDDFAKGMDEIVNATRADTRAAVEAAVKTATAGKQPGKTAMGGATVGGGLGFLLQTVEPVTGALIGAGVADTVITRTLPSLLKNTAFAKWAMNIGKSATAGDIGTNLTALIASKALTAEESALARELIPTKAEPRPSQRQSRRGVDTERGQSRRPKPPRAANGQFAPYDVAALDGFPIKDGDPL